MIIETLNTLSFNCEFHSPNSIFFDGKKISGNAQIFKGNSVLHQGTLLLSSDLESLDSALNSQIINQNSKCVRSNKARTTNLFFINSKWTEEDVISRAVKIIQKTLNLNLKTDEFTKEELEYAMFLKFKRYCNINWLFEEQSHGQSFTRIF